MDEQIRRKIVLVLILLAAYAGVSFWIPYSRLWLMKDLMETQARLFYAYQSPQRVRDFLMGKAGDMNIPLLPDGVKVQNINGEIIYIELSWEAPVNIFFFHTSLHFAPKIYGLIHGFDDVGTESSLGAPDTSALSDSTNRFLRRKGLLQHTIGNFFTR